MLGVALSFYKEPLTRVPVHLNRKPIDALNLTEVLINKPELLEFYVDESQPIKDQIHRLPLAVYTKPTLDHICKIRESSFIMMNSSVEDLFEKNINFFLIRKITSSAWRWGHQKAKWNDLVDAYERIRGFKLNRTDFTVRLDYTTHYNEVGYSQYTRTYLDGSLAYLLYYKGEHVLTIGFSLMANRQILIQQVQLKKQKGNRWLFKFPKNYLEYVIDLFYENFPKYRLYIVNGEDTSKNYINDYKQVLDSTERELLKAPLLGSDRWGGYASLVKERDRLKAKIKLLKTDAPRLENFYSNTGHYKKLKRAFTCNRKRFYRLERIIATN